MIEIVEQFTVPASAKRTWDVMSDPRAVVECIPGASLDEDLGDGSYKGSVAVRFGPLRVSFAGTAALEVDETELTGQLTGQGRDGQGSTKFRAKAEYHITPIEEDASLVVMTGTVTISGKLASAIEGGANVVVSQMVADFAVQLAALCRPPTSDAVVAPKPQNAVPMRVWIKGVAAAVWSLIRGVGRRKPRSSVSESESESEAN
ncbi:SRPBCC family protein [Jatrophihabitans sp. DSM 45814]